MGGKNGQNLHYVIFEWSLSGFRDHSYIPNSQANPNQLLNKYQFDSFIYGVLLFHQCFALFQATEDVQEGITDEDYDLFYEIWQEFDPDGTQYMSYKNLLEFVDVLEPPLQISKPNKFKIIHMDIPIVRWTDPSSGEIKENMVFCTDILDALTQDFFARKGNPIDEPPHVDEIKVNLSDLNFTLKCQMKPCNYNSFIICLFVLVIFI